MQNVPEYLTQRIFATLAGLKSLDDFEKWLYSQEHLTEKMSEDLYLDLFAFNYKGKDALYEFDSLMKAYYGNQEHIKWKVKSRLEKVAKGEKLEDEILRTFYEFWYRDDLEFLRPLAMIFLELDESWNSPDRELLKDKSCKVAADILSKFKAEESLPGFKLSGFGYRVPDHFILKNESEVAEKSNSEKMWWEFWK